MSIGLIQFLIESFLNFKHTAIWPMLIGYGLNNETCFSIQYTFCAYKHSLTPLLQCKEFSIPSNWERRSTLAKLPTAIWKIKLTVNLTEVDSKRLSVTDYTQQIFWGTTHQQQLCQQPQLQPVAHSQVWYHKSLCPPPQGLLHSRYA